MTFRKCLRLAPAILLTSVLAACSHVPVASMAKLASLDLMTTDLSALRAAVRAPSGIAARPNGAQLLFSYWRSGEESRKTTVTATLEEVNAPEDTAPLAAEEKKGMRFTVFRITDADRARIEASRAEIAATRAAEGGKAGGRMHGTIAISIDGCIQAPVPDGPLLATTYLRTAAGDDYVALLRDIDLRTLGDGGTGTGAASLKPCHG